MPVRPFWARIFFRARTGHTLEGVGNRGTLSTFWYPIQKYPNSRPFLGPNLTHAGPSILGTVFLKHTMLVAGWWEGLGQVIIRIGI